MHPHITGLIYKRTSFALAKLEASEHNAFGIRLYFYHRYFTNQANQFYLRKTRGVGTKPVRYKSKLSPSLFYKPSGTSFAYAKLEASERSPFGIRLHFYRRHYSVGLFLKDLLSKIACPSPISCSINARAFNGRPNNVINPSASLWL